MILKSKQTA